MKILGLIRPSHALIALLLASAAMISGCAGTAGFKKTKSFYPEYYAARRLQNTDIVKLRELTVNPDPFIADSATLLLGSYYLYYGDKNYGRFLIDKSYRSKNLDEEMTLFGQLWKMESLLSEGERGAAINMASNIKEMRRTPVYMRVMQIYCNQLGIFAVGSDEINACVDMAIKGKEKFKSSAEPQEAEKETDLPISTDNMTYEEYLEAMGIGGAVNNFEGSSTIVEDMNIKPDVKINIAGGDIFDEVVQGMIFAMGKYDNNYQIEPVSDFAANENDKNSMLLRVNSLDIFIGGHKTGLAVNWIGLSEIAAELNIVTNKELAVIVAPETRMAHGKIIADAVKNAGKKALLINYNGSYQKDLTAALQSAENRRYSIILLGEEKDILDMVPIAKYWQVNSQLQDVLIITGIISDIKGYEEQQNYFKGTYILTAANLPSIEKYTAVSKDYEGFFGQSMTAKNAIGYDVIVYINSLIKNGKKGEYLTNIKEIVNGYAVRVPVLLYVGSKGVTVRDVFDGKNSNDGSGLE